MRIGEMARQANVSVKTIRYYEDIGVLPPPDRTPAGYRDYGHDTVDRLAFIRAAQSLGLTLGEIREIVALRDQGETPCGHVADLVRRRTTEVEQRIADLRHLHDELNRLSRRAATLHPEDCQPKLVCHLIAPGSGTS